MVVDARYTDSSVTYTLSIHKVATIKWRATSFWVCLLYNFVDVPHYSLDDFAAFPSDDLAEWQGRTTVLFGILGRTTQISLSQGYLHSGQDPRRNPIHHCGHSRSRCITWKFRAT
jgi:hypothetical protein